jgi:serine/threonine protein kinase/pimeloyl-ACP methyl ester carboxylesterase/tetratricopeptide (TPR) repeat protein
MAQPRQTVRMVETRDAVSLAWASIGAGPVLVKASTWLTHLEYDQESPVWRHWTAFLADHFRYVRYDERGCGMSQRDVASTDPDRWIEDLAAVIDAAAPAGRIALLGISQGAIAAIQYAVAHPDRVSHIILYGAYAQGVSRRGDAEAVKRYDAIVELMRQGWGRDNPVYRQVFTARFIPGGTNEQLEWWNELCRRTASPEMAVRLMQARMQADVVELLPRVRVPTLVMHARRDEVVPFSQGQLLASKIPEARFVELDSANHVLLENEPAWRRFQDELLSFIGVDAPRDDATSATVASPRLDSLLRGLARAPEVAPSERLPATLLHYRVVEKIGQGGMGEVYRADDTRLRRPVAIKVIAPRGRADPDARTRLFREARAASALQHPHIVTVFAIEEDAGRDFIVMEWMEGETLAAEIARGPLALERLLDVGAQIADALAAAHAASIIHRDLKPANVMLVRGGHAKVLDFGLAKRLDHELDGAKTALTREGAAIGTVAYMSPEQTRGEALDSRTDIFSLGALLYEAATGRLAFDGPSALAIMHEVAVTVPPKPSAVRADLPAAFDEVVARALAKDRAARYASAADFRDALRDVARAPRPVSRPAREVAVAVAQEDRKLVSALVIDLSPAPSIERADPEDVRELVRVVNEPVRRHIERYGGAIHGHAGDATIVVFGATAGRGDEAERAVRCALDIVRTVAGCDAAGTSVRLVARATVATGDAIVTRASSALASGDVVSAAARLQSLASAGVVVVGSETYRATRRAFRSEPMPGSEAWRVIAPVPAGDGLHGTSSFVGRHHELEQLRATLERVVQARRPQLVTVLGPPGIGKSRLVMELARRAEADGARRIYGRCLPYEEGAYRVSFDHVKHIAGILETDSLSTARAKLLAAVAEHVSADEAADVGHHVCLLFGLGSDGAAYGGMPLPMRQPRFFAMRRLLEGVSRSRPTLLVFEDLHWADRSQLELLEYLCANMQDVAVLFVALARPELAERQLPWAAGSIPHATIPVGPLSPSESVALLGAAGTAAAPAIADRLVEVAGGNPLFLEELAASAQAGGEGVLPSSLREVIGARIDALSSQERSVLVDASVIGQTFWRGVLASISRLPLDPLDAALDALAQRGLVHYVPRSRVDGDVEFSFKHVLVREGAYGTLPRAARRAKHAAVARCMEGSGTDVTDFAGMLAHHWREAGEPQRAIHYLLLAAKRARDGWAKEEAIALFGSALDLVADQDVATRSQIRLLRALCLAELADFAAASVELDDLLPSLTVREQFEATLVRARMAYWMEETEQAYAFADQSRALVEVIGDRELVGPAIAVQSSARHMRGELDQALAFGHEASRAWVPGTRPTDLAAHSEMLAQPSYWVGDYEETERLARTACDVGSEHRHLEPLLRGGAWRGLALAAQGRSEEAIAWLDAIFRRSQESDPGWGAGVMNCSSLAFRDMCMFDEARARNQRALEVVGERGVWGMAEVEAEIDLMFADLAVGELGRVELSFPRVWDAVINGKAWRPWLGGGRLALVRAELASQREGPDATISYARDAIDRARRAGRRKYDAAARVILGAALVERGDADEGLVELGAAVEESDRLRTPTGRWRARATLAQALYRTGDDDAASRVYREAVDVIRAYAAGLSTEHAARFVSAEPVAAVLSRSHASDELFPSR